MSNINVVQSCFNFSRLKEIKKISKQFEVSNSKNKKSGQQFSFQKVWKHTPFIYYFFKSTLTTNQTFSLEWPWFDVLLMSLAFVLVDLENAKVPILWQMQSLGQVQNEAFWQVFVWSFKVHIFWEGRKISQNFVAFSEYMNFNFVYSILHNNFWIKQYKKG